MWSKTTFVALLILQQLSTWLMGETAMSNKISNWWHFKVVSPKRDTALLTGDCMVDARPVLTTVSLQPHTDGSAGICHTGEHLMSSVQLTTSNDILILCRTYFMTFNLTPSMEESTLYLNKTWLSEVILIPEVMPTSCLTEITNKTTF